MLYGNIILADVGGTHVRFTVLNGKALHEPRKYACADYPGMAEALAVYCTEINHEKGGTILIAAAANPDAAGHWRFGNKNLWVIDLAVLEKAGWKAECIVNDFEASAYGASVLPADKLVIFREGVANDYPRALMGPGTGLGLGYLIPLPNGATHVQKAKGGHMLATARTDEQHAILKIVARLRGGGTVPVFEDAVSGRGIPYLYKAVCVMHGQSPYFENAEAMLAHPDDRMVKKTLRLFHEFFGLFAHNAVVTGSAFGGIYLDGGVMHRLHEKNLFDFDVFSQYMVLNCVPVVRDLLAATPIYMISDPYVALRGLAELHHKNGGQRHAA